MTATTEDSILRIGMAQMAPVWLNKAATIEKIKSYISSAGESKCDLVVFGEGLLPGYPFWLSLTKGSEFNSSVQKEIHAHYMRNAVQIESGDLDSICALARQHKVAIYLGAIERAENRGGHSLYCSLVYIDKSGDIQSVHRKLQPTYEERLTWAPGDGAGLQVHKLKAFTVGGLNCWENWMPLSRAALYAQGEDLHVACWPGNDRNTADLTPILAKEGRSYAVSVSAIMRPGDVRDDTPFADEIRAALGDLHANGGSCVAAPDGSWVLPPVTGEEGIRYCELDPAFVRRERQNFDPSGHYSRPDVTRLVVNRERQTLASFED